MTVPLGRGDCVKTCGRDEMAGLGLVSILVWSVGLVSTLMWLVLTCTVAVLAVQSGTRQWIAHFLAGSTCSLLAMHSGLYSGMVCLPRPTWYRTSRRCLQPWYTFCLFATGMIAGWMTQPCCRRTISITDTFYPSSSMLRPALWCLDMAVNAVCICTALPPRVHWQNGMFALSEAACDAAPF